MKELDRHGRRIFVKAFNLLNSLNKKRPEWIAVQLLIEPGLGSHIAWFIEHNLGSGPEAFAGLKAFAEALPSFIDKLSKPPETVQ